MNIITSNIINNLIVLIYYLEHNNNINFNDFVNIFILDGIEIPYNTININSYIDNLIYKIRLFFNERITSLNSTRYDYIKNKMHDKYFDRLQLYNIYKNKINNFKTKWKELLRYRYEIIRKKILNDLNYDQSFKDKLKDKTRLEIIKLLNYEILKIKDNFKNLVYENYSDEEISNYYNLKDYQYENQLRILDITKFNYIDNFEKYELLIDNEIENFKKNIIDNIPSIYDLDETDKYSDYLKENFINLYKILDEILIRKKFKYFNLQLNLNIKIFFNEHITSLNSTRYDYINNKMHDKYFDRLQLYNIYKNKINNFKTKWKELIKYKYKIINEIANINDLNYDELFKDKIKNKKKLEIINLVDNEILRLKNDLKNIKYYNNSDEEISNYYNLKKFQYINQLKILNITDYVISEINYIEKLEEYEILIDNEIDNFKQIIINNIPSIYDLDTLDINIIKYIRRTYIYDDTQKNNLINQIKYYDTKLYSDYFKDNFNNLENTLDNISNKKKSINLNLPLNSNIIKNYQKINNIFNLDDCNMLDNFLIDFYKDHITISDTLEYNLTLEETILTTENYYNFKKYLYNISRIIPIDITNISTYKQSLKKYIYDIYNGINYQYINNIYNMAYNKINLKYREYFNIALENRNLENIKNENPYYYYNLLNRYLLLLEEEFDINDEIISYIKNIRNNDKYNISKQLNSNSSEKICKFLNINIENDYFKKIEFII